jgi:hypothetical protein
MSDDLELTADEEARAEALELGQRDAEDWEGYEEYLAEQEARRTAAELDEMLDAMAFEDRINGGLDIEG